MFCRLLKFDIHYLVLQTKLVKMFSKQLVSKASIVNIIEEPRLEQYPNTEQWLKVVGLPSNTVKVS